MSGRTTSSVVELARRSRSRGGGFRTWLSAVVSAALIASAAVAIVAPPEPAAAVPPNSEYPASWTYTDNKHATGVTPSGVTVTATITSPAGGAVFAGDANGMPLMIAGTAPAYFPATTNQALRIRIDSCTNTAPDGCGTISYSFSRAVETPVLYAADIGAGAGSPFSTYHDAPITLTSGGTFTLDAPTSVSMAEVANASTTLQHSPAPASMLGTPLGANSCNPHGCAVVDILTPTPEVTTVSMGFGYRGNGTDDDGFSLLLGVTPVPPEPVACDTMFALGYQGNPATLYTIDPGTGALSALWGLPNTGGGFTGGTSALNALAVDASTNTYWAAQQQLNDTTATLVKLDGATGVATTLGPFATGTAVATGFFNGAFNPATGIYYLAGQTGSNGLIFGYNTLTNTWLGQVATIPVPAGSNNIADFAFDASGRLYYVTDNASGTAPTRLIRTNVPLPTTGSTATLPTTVIMQTATNQAPSDGVSFGSDGYLYVSSFTSNTINKLDPSSGAVVSTATMAPAGAGIGDLASCAAPNPIRLQKNLPSGRVAVGDQFSLSITGGGLSTGNMGLTAGTESGVQNQSTAEVAGPVLGLAGTTYTITEAGASGANLATYQTSWSCVNTLDGNAQIASGTGTPGSFTMPDGGATGADILCTFTNEPERTTLTLQKNVAGRVQPSDQFSLSITGGTPPVSGDTTGLTTGTDTGTQSAPAEVAGPVDVVPGGTYTIGEVGSGTAAGQIPVRYDVSYTCVNAATNAVIVPPTVGQTGTVTIPNTFGVDVVCTLTNTPKVISPELSLAKSVTPTSFVGPGGTATYSFLVTNTGDVAITDASIEELAFDGSGTMSAITCPADNDLSVGESMTCTATYVITTADVAQGVVNNTAIAHGTDPFGGNVDSNEDDAVIAITEQEGFPCVTPTIFDANQPLTRLDQQFQNAGGSTFTPVPFPNPGWQYNSIAFNEADDLIYAVSVPSPSNPTLYPGNRLLRIGPAGIVDLGAITGIPPGNGTPGTEPGMHLGAFDDEGNYWVGKAATSLGVGNANGHLYRVDLTTRVATELAGQTFPINANDIAWADGYFWGATNLTRNMVRIDIATGNVQVFGPQSFLHAGPAGSATAGIYGAAWTYGNGNLGFDENNGGLIQVDIANPGSANPTFTLVGAAGGPASGNNDGTACTNPTDLSIEKTASTAEDAANGGVVVEDGVVSWTLTVTNEGPGNSSGFVVDDDIPVGYTNVTTSTPGCAITGAGTPVSPYHLKCVEGVLEVGDSFDIELQGTAPDFDDATAACLDNIAVVLGNEEDSNSDNNEDNAETCILHYTVSKTASAIIGGVVTYTVAIVNDGGGAYTAAMPATFEDDLSDVLEGADYNDDATTTLAGWSFGWAEPTLTGSGPLAVGASGSITYTVTLNGELPADATLTNVVTPTGPGGECQDGDPAECTTDTPLPELIVRKDVRDAGGNSIDGETVVGGDELTYVLTFVNTGGADAPVDYSDDLSDVLDDIVEAPGAIVFTVAPPGAVTVSAIVGGVFSVTGTMAPGSMLTVSYTVTVKPTEDLTPPATLVNVLYPTGEEPPTECEPGDPLCTENPTLGYTTWSKVPGGAPSERLAGSEWSLTGPTGPGSTTVAIVDCVITPCAGPDLDPAPGEFRLANLAWGAYTLVETKAPAGYVLDATPHDFEIGEGDFSIDLGDFVNQQQPTLALPLTGGLGSDLFLFAGVGVLGAALVFIVAIQRRGSHRNGS